MRLGKTQLVIFVLVNGTPEVAWEVKKDGVITRIAYQASGDGAVVADLRLWRDGEMLFPEAGVGTSGAPQPDSHSPTIHATTSHQWYNVFEPVTKGDVLRLTGTSGSGEIAYVTLSILPVDALVTKLHRDTIAELARMIKNG